MRIRSMVSLMAGLFAAGAGAQPQAVQVLPTNETAEVAGTGGNAPVGVSVRVHPSDPSLSFVMLTSATSGLLTFGLDGRFGSAATQSQGATAVDLREGFPFSVGSGGLVALANLNALTLYRVVDVADAGSSLALVPAVNTPASPFLVSTVALYQSPTTRKFYVFVGDGTGQYEQRELLPQADGSIQVSTSNARVLDVQAASTAITADDTEAALYVGDVQGRLWRFGAEPEQGDAGVLVASAEDGGLPAQAVTGLAVYRLAGSGGYLVAANAASSRFTVLDRASPQAVRGTFDIGRDGGVDPVENPRALALSASPLLPGYPGGLLVAHDALNEGGGENAKLVAWSSVAQAFSPALNNSAPDAGDGGITDGGADAGPPAGGVVPPGANGQGSPVDDSNCSCTSSSVPGAVLLGLVAVVLRRRRGAGRA